MPPRQPGQQLVGDDVRNLMVAAVEHRFGRVNRLPRPIEWLSDNDSPDVTRETRTLTRDIGLLPKTTPLESPQSNGMAEAFVRTYKRDHVGVSDCADAQTVLRSLPAWFTHYNEVHPHRALAYRSSGSSSVPSSQSDLPDPSGAKTHGGCGCPTGGGAARQHSCRGALLVVGRERGRRQALGIASADVPLKSTPLVIASAARRPSC
jgi:hypothetical protein